MLTIATYIYTLNNSRNITDLDFLIVSRFHFSNSAIASIEDQKCNLLPLFLNANNKNEAKSDYSGWVKMSSSSPMTARSRSTDVKIVELNQFLELFITACSVPYAIYAFDAEANKTTKTIRIICLWKCEMRRSM